MAIQMPNIDIIFKQLATSLIARSERGIAILIIKDTTTNAPIYTEYTDITGVNKDKSKYTASNLQYIKDIFNYALNKVVVVNEATVSESLETIEKNVKTGWITIADGTQEEFDTLSSWIKAKELIKKNYKAICYKAAVTDCKHIVNYYNEKITFVDSRGEVTGEKCCPSLIGVLASCNIKKGCTYYKLTNLKHVEEVSDRDSALQSGKFILVNDGEFVRIALGINSMTTTDGINNTEDMKFIDTVEAMDIINDDVSNVFKNDYISNYKNKYDNQMLLISAINGYLKDLAKIDVLDIEYENKAEIDVEAQRNAWLSVGKAEASNWTDIQVKRNTFKRSVFLAGQVKILGSMTDLSFTVNLF